MDSITNVVAVVVVLPDGQAYRGIITGGDTMGIWVQKPYTSPARFDFAKISAIVVSRGG